MVVGLGGERTAPGIEDHQRVDAGLTLGSSSLLQGRFIEITVSGGTVPDGSPHKDYTVRVTATTTRGTVQAEVTVRVYP